MSDGLGEPAPERLAQHVRILGIVSVAYSGLQIIIGLLVLLLLTGIGAFAQAKSGEPVGPVLGVVGTLIFVVVLVISLPMLVAGIGLLKRQAWPRILTFIVAALSVLNFPIGTAYGAYAFWALTRPGIEQVLESS